MKSSTRREEVDQRERGLISRGDRVLPGGEGAWVGVLKPEKEASDTVAGASPGNVHGEKQRRAGERQQGREQGFQNLTPLIRNPRDNR